MDHSHDNQVILDFYLCVCAHVCMHDRRRKGEREQGMREKERKSREEGQMEQMEREDREKEAETDKKTEGAEREDIVIQLSKQDVKHTQKCRFWAN